MERGDIMNKTIYYILSYTWGLPLNLIGLLVEVFLKIFGFEYENYGPCRAYKIGNNWGGFELGHVIIVNNNPSEHILNHEFGHSIQNAILGPFYLIVIWIPSMIRYQYRRLQKRIDKNKELPPYDSIWFEGSATELGYKYIEYFE
jgi:hypothetical protein